MFNCQIKANRLSPTIRGKKKKKKKHIPLRSLLWLVNLCNRSGEERRRQTLCDKRDNNYVWNHISLNFTSLWTDLSVKDQKTLIHVKWRSKDITQIIALSRLTRTSVLLSSFFLPSCWVKQTTLAILTVPEVFAKVTLANILSSEICHSYFNDSNQSSPGSKATMDSHSIQTWEETSRYDSSFRPSSVLWSTRCLYSYRLNRHAELAWEQAL